MRGKNREGLKFSKYTSMTTSTADCISPASVIRDGTVYSQSYVGGLGSKFHQQQQLSTSLSSLLASTNSGANSGASPQQNSSGNVVRLATEYLKRGRHSLYRGIIKRKNRWEAHVWKEGKQNYLGGYKEEEEAARAYDLAVLKIRGAEGETNFPATQYQEELERLKADTLTVEEFILALRERAKRRNKQLKEEEEEREIAMLKPLGDKDFLNTYLEEMKKKDAKRKRLHDDVVCEDDAAMRLDVQKTVMRKLKTELILNNYVEMTKKAKKKQRTSPAQLQGPPRVAQQGSILGSIPALLYGASSPPSSSNYTNTNTIGAGSHRNQTMGVNVNLHSGWVHPPQQLLAQILQVDTLLQQQQNPTLAHILNQMQQQSQAVPRANHNSQPNALNRTVSVCTSTLTRSGSTHSFKLS